MHGASATVARRIVTSAIIATSPGISGMGVPGGWRGPPQGRRPPVPATHQLHRCRERDKPDDGGVHEHRQRQSESDLLDDLEIAGAECGEHDQHDQRRAGHDPGRSRETRLRPLAGCRHVSSHASRIRESMITS